jgi:predicted GNAT superfamily acetyltransferase
MNRAVIAMVGFSQAADLVTTAWGMAHGAYESNPTARLILEAGGVPLAALVKLGIVLGVILGFRLIVPKLHAFWSGAWLGSAAVMFMVAGMNLKAV